MSSTTTTTTTTQQESGGGPSGLTSVGLASLIVKTREVNGADASISSVPLSESRGLPLEQNTNPNPPNWPTTRGTPQYNPLVTDYSFDERPLGQNGGEATFLVFMFSGVYGIHVLNKAWRSTFGQLTDSVWKYKIGGHW